MLVLPTGGMPKEMVVEKTVALTPKARALFAEFPILENAKLRLGDVIDCRIERADGSILKFMPEEADEAYGAHHWQTMYIIDRHGDPLKRLKLGWFKTSNLGQVLARMRRSKLLNAYALVQIERGGLLTFFKPPKGFETVGEWYLAHTIAKSQWNEQIYAEARQQFAAEKD